MGRDPFAATDEDHEYPLLSTEPDTVAVNPARRFRNGIVLLAVAVVLLAGVSAYTATALAGERTDQHTEQLLAELNRRTAERNDQAAYTAAVLEQNRRTLCELLPAVEQTDKIRQLTRAYRCGTAKDALVPPGWTAPPGWPQLPPGPAEFGAGTPDVQPSTGS
ncbi:hypothetical protein [Actinoplanes sp. URMC 104]|uniref:hypothetical protein n=1 Tax=Actinoplanes sp. URMC 104 TaxID=3423409 RepID=UPI003F1BDBA8